MKTKFILFLTAVFLLQGCSRQEYFVITNETTADIIIEYKLKKTPEGFPIFDQHPKSYALNDDGAIYWDKLKSIKDTDTIEHFIHITLPPNTGLIIGRLSNDEYKSYDQDFINNRHFNLERLKIISDDKRSEIYPETFDSFFTKENGLILHRVK